MKGKETMKETEIEMISIARKLRRRDFKGNTGTAIRNSGYQFATTIIAKVGSLLFTIIMARLLMPELYGLYGLALSTILFLSLFSDFGIETAISTYVSKTIDKRPGKAKGYFFYLAKFKIILILGSSLLILLMANFFANYYYEKPIFWALIAGSIYFPLMYLSRFLGLIFVAKNNFRVYLIGEILLQTSRLVILPLLIFYLLSLSFGFEAFLFWIFIGLSICFAIIGIFYLLYYLLYNPFGKAKKETLSSAEKKDIGYFILPLTVTAFSGLFFGSIDTIMLGHYVASEFIGFYQVAFNLISSAAVIVGFSAVAMLPIFSRLEGKKLDEGFRKTRNITFLISCLAMLFTIIFAPLLIRIIYGGVYMPSLLYLRIFSLLLLSFPLSGLYQTYYTSQKRTKPFSILLVVSTIINIILNFVFINIGLMYGMEEAVFGACLATIISRYGYLVGLVLWRRR